MKMTAKQLAQFIYEIRNKIFDFPVDILSVCNNIDPDYPDGILLFFRVLIEHKSYFIKITISNDDNIDILFSNSYSHYFNECGREEEKIEFENKRREVEENIKILYNEIINNFN